MSKDWDNKVCIERINTYLQTVAYLVAAIWTGYYFYRAEVNMPESHTNVTLDARLSIAGSPTDEDGIQVRAGSREGIQLEISARNPSQRTIGILATSYVVVAHEYAAEVGDTDPELPANIAVNSRFQRHTRVVSSKVIAYGPLISDSHLKPNEQVKRSITFVVPTSAYDVVEVNIAVATALPDSELAAHWTVTANGRLEDHVCRGALRDHVCPVETELGNDEKDEAHESGDSRLSMNTARRQYSLWRLPIGPSPDRGGTTKSGRRGIQ